MTHSRHAIVAPMACLWQFTEAVIVMRLLRKQSIGMPAQALVTYLGNALMNTAAVEWCKVFGSNAQDTHWTNVAPSVDHARIRAEIAGATGLGEAGWTAYRAHIVAFRDQLAAHHDLGAAVASFPDYTHAQQAGALVYDELGRHLGPGLPLPQSLGAWPGKVERRHELSMLHLMSGRAGEQTEERSD
jgi:hypothetical protein